MHLKIQEGDAHHITCPGYECDKLVPVEVIEMIVSREMARRYLQFDIKVSTLRRSVLLIEKSVVELSFLMLQYIQKTMYVKM